MTTRGTSSKFSASHDADELTRIACGSPEMSKLAYTVSFRYLNARRYIVAKAPIVVRSSITIQR